MMAQVSSVTSIIRQMGGSSGVAIFSHVLTQRTNYHAQRYSEALNYTGEVYRQTVDKLGAFVEQSAGVSGQSAHSIAGQMIDRHLQLEAYIGGINDDFYVTFIVTLLSLLPIFWLRKTK